MQRLKESGRWLGFKIPLMAYKVKVHRGLKKLWGSGRDIGDTIECAMLRDVWGEERLAPEMAEQDAGAKTECCDKDKQSNSSIEASPTHANHL